jgi:hypothetical protein
MTPRKLNNSILFYRICFSILSIFSAVVNEAGRQWEMVWEDVGCAGATANFIAPRCNN